MLVSYMCYSKACRLLTTYVCILPQPRVLEYGVPFASKFTSAGCIYFFFAAAQNGMVVGVFQHFQLALQAVALPLPSRGYDCCAHAQHVKVSVY